MRVFVTGATGHIASIVVLLGMSSIVSCAPRYATHREPACPPTQAQTRYNEDDSLAGVIAGVIVDRDTGRPLVGSRIQVTSPSQFTTSDSVGAFFIPGVSPGQHSVTVLRTGYERHTDTVTMGIERGVRTQIALTPAAVDRCMEIVEVRTRLPWWHFW